MSKQCTKCNLSNPANSLYCNHCGHELDIDIRGNDNQSYNQTLSKECQRIHDKFKHEIKEEALELKFKMLDEFQKKATNWAKVQFATLATAIAIVTVVLGYVGLNSLDVTKTIEQLQKDTEKSVEDTQNKFNKEVESTLANFKASSEKFNVTAESSIKDLKTKRDEFNEKVALAETMINDKTEKLSKFNSDQIEIYEKNLLQAKKDNETLQRNLNNQVARIDSQIEKINKLGNSRFRILVHYRETTVQLYQKNIGLLESTLLEKGFIIDINNIANVSSDRQEILYYSKSIAIIKKVEEIQQQLSDKFNNIPIRFESAGSFDPLQVVIKLCPQGKNSGSYCAIEPASENK